MTRVPVGGHQPTLLQRTDNRALDGLRVAVGGEVTTGTSKRSFSAAASARAGALRNRAWDCDDAATMLTLLVMAAAPASSWIPRVVADGGVSIELLAGVPVTEAPSFVGQPPAALFFGDASTLCGRPATLQEVRVPGELATGLVVGPKGELGHLEHQQKSRVHVALAGTMKTGVPFVATWVVDADERDARRAAEARFFSSIRCR